jgi:hypothetical protein
MIIYRHNGSCISGTKSINDEKTFHCNCTPGHDGSNCEKNTDMCGGIICENGGVCISSYPSWSCKCIDPSLYSGKLCERKSAALRTKQMLSKSFASVAITAIVAVFLFVIIMDVLKYGFKIDPVDRERQLMKAERKKKPFQKTKKRQTKVALRLYYIP